MTYKERFEAAQVEIATLKAAHKEYAKQNDSLMQKTERALELLRDTLEIVQEEKRTLKYNLQKAEDRLQSRDSLIGRQTGYLMAQSDALTADARDKQEGSWTDHLGALIAAPSHLARTGN